MKRILAALAALVLVGQIGHAELLFTRVAAVATSQTVTINTRALVVVNDSTSNEIYVRVFTEGETVGAATTSNAEIKATESWEFKQELAIKAISIICASGETASVRLLYQ